MSGLNKSIKAISCEIILVESLNKLVSLKIIFPLTVEALIKADIPVKPVDGSPILSAILVSVPPNIDEIVDPAPPHNGAPILFVIVLPIEFPSSKELIVLIDFNYNVIYRLSKNTTGFLLNSGN